MNGSNYKAIFNQYKNENISTVILIYFIIVIVVIISIIIIIITSILITTSITTLNHYPTEIHGCRKGSPNSLVIIFIIHFNRLFFFIFLVFFLKYCYYVR